MDRLEPIPSPPGHIFREFCHRVVPVLAFAGAVVATGFLWNQRFTGTLLFGEVSPLHAEVSTAEAGRLVDLRIAPFETVTNGQIVATLQSVHPDAVQRSLAVIRSELAVLRSRMELDQIRNEQDVEGLRVRWLEARVDLATASVALENARQERDRMAGLFEDRIVSESEYDLARSTHDSLAAEVKERATMVDNLQDILGRLDGANRSDRGSSMDVLADSLEAQEKQLAAQGSVALRSPIDGVVKSVNHLVGEWLPAGAVVAVIGAPRSERIVGYVRQPLTLDPTPGMPVEVRTRGIRRQVARTKILSVGSELEPLTNPLRIRGLDNASERGLPFFVAVPPELRLRPGELVDLIVRPQKP